MEELDQLLQKLSERELLLILGFDSSQKSYIGQFLSYNGNILLMEETKSLNSLLPLLMDNVQ